MKKYLLKFKGLFAVSIILIVSLAFTNVYSAVAIKKLVDSASEKEFNLFFKFLVLTFLIIIAILLLEFIRKVVIQKFVKKCVMDLKTDLFNKIIIRDVKSFNSENSAYYISTLTNDISIIEESYFNNILDVIQTIIQFLFAFYVMAKFNLVIAVVAVGLSIFPILSPKITEK